MGKLRKSFTCRECGVASATWNGRCSGCGEWNTLDEVVTRAEAPTGGGPVAKKAERMVEVDLTAFIPRPTGVEEFDRVLSGGLVPGSVTLLGGEPGIGKSTLLLQAASAIADTGTSVLYVTAEESTAQIRARAERLGHLTDDLWVAGDTDLDSICDQLTAVRPALLIVDSIQTIGDRSISSAPGSVVQVRECAHRLATEARARGVAIVLVGHVTKDGGLAGPRVLEHLVDTVLSFEGDRHHALRLLRTTKHRYGATSELGMFEMTERGLRGVPDASGMLLGDRQPGLSGSVVVPALEGSRPILVEVQALASQSAGGPARRAGQGIDTGRLSTMLAVLEQRIGLKLSAQDVHCLAVGGIKVVEPAADLALVLAVVSSMTGEPLSSGLVACAEVGLGGELRSVGQLDRRLDEAFRLGFRTALVPRSAPDGPPGMEVVRINSVAQALAFCGLTTASTVAPGDPF